MLLNHVSFPLSIYSKCLSNAGAPILMEALIIPSVILLEPPANKGDSLGMTCEPIETIA